MPEETAKEKQEPQPLGEMRKDNLETLAAMETLATIAVACLRNYGQVTFGVLPDGSVAYANPAHVHIHPQAFESTAEKPFRYRRPILGDGRPTFVAWKDGLLWEVEFVDEQLEENQLAESRRQM